MNTVLKFELKKEVDGPLGDFVSLTINGGTYHHNPNVYQENVDGTLTKLKMSELPKYIQDEIIGLENKPFDNISQQG